MNVDIVLSYAPIFSQQSYSFSLDITNNTNKRVFVGQISAQPFNINRSHLVYEFIHSPKYLIINPDSGIIEYIQNTYDYTMRGYYRVVVRDLIYQQNTTTNVTINIFKSDLVSMIYHQTISEIVPQGSVIFQPNISTIENLQYSLQDCNPNVFIIDPNTGEVSLVNHLSELFYSFKIHVAPINRILMIKLTVTDYNNHPPMFSHLPLNLTISSDDTFVTKLSAHDLDLPDNKNLRYYLLDKNQQQTFSISQTTGIITLNAIPNQHFVPLKVAASDGVHFTKSTLAITINNYSKNPPKFPSDEYQFEYKKILGQITAYDDDPNDRIVYKVYLEPDGVQIDQYSGIITIQKELFPQIIEFYASATDYAQQTAYTKIQIVFPIQPKFSSNLYFISLNPTIRIPSEIFHFQLVDLFNRPLLLTRFQINQTNIFEINENKLILKKKIHPSKIYHLNIYGFWKNFTCQTTIQIRFLERIFKLNKRFYEFLIEENLLTENYLIKKFEIRNSTIKITSTPLTINSCHENFYIEENKFYFKNFPILSNLCFFELQLLNEMSISTSQIKISFTNSNIKPKFSSTIYYIYSNNTRIFAKGLNNIRYKLQANPYGLIINPTNGLISFKFDLNRMKTFNPIELLVYAIDEKTYLNDTASIQIILNRKKPLEVPNDISSCSNRPISISDQTSPSKIIYTIEDSFQSMVFLPLDSIIQNIHRTNNISNYYYIISGNHYGLFSINNNGQIYLVSSLLNRTSEEYFELTILRSSFSVSFCRINISISRSPNWSNFVCPLVSIQWTIEEESPIGTKIGNITEVLLTMNNYSQLIERINIKLTNNTDAQGFDFDSSTGLIISKARLDYEEKHFYLLSMVIEPTQINCSLSIMIKLININDNPISFNRHSLIYTIDENNLIPLYIGRIDLNDIDQMFSFNYKYYLKNNTTKIRIDSTTGSIILFEKLDREIHGDKVQYDIIAIDYVNRKNLTDVLVININDVNDHGPIFEKDIYHISVNKSTIPGRSIFQITASSYDPIMNGNISYYLKNSSSIFSIDKYTGNIRSNDYIPSTMANITLSIEAVEDGINLTDRTNVLLTIINDDYIYFNLENRNRCFIDENQRNGTIICSVGKESVDFMYSLIDPMNFFDVLSNNGTIINRKMFDYEIDKHEYDVTIIVQDRKNQVTLKITRCVWMRDRNRMDFSVFH